MHWLGNANWYLPRWIDRSLPRLDLERLEESQLELDPPAEPPERDDSTLELNPTFRRRSSIPG
jgi:hypothetical protein